MGGRIPARGATAWLIAGPWGAAKRRVIRRLAGFKPAGERWTVMAGDLGEDMLDPGEFAPLGIAVRGAAYGCPCCLGNLPLRVKLGRLLRETAPDRLLLELPPGTHLEAAVALFRDPLLAPAITLQAVLYVIDAAGAEAPLPEAVRSELAAADRVLVADAPAALIEGLGAQHPGVRFTANPGELADLIRAGDPAAPRAH